MAERTKETDTSTERVKEDDTSLERTKETDSATERVKETDTATERVKETNGATEREITGGPGYDFSQTNIFWDREDIFFDSVILHATERTQVSDGAVERTKPTANQCLSLTGSGYASISDAAQTGLDMGLSDFMVEMRVKLTVPIASQPEAVAYLFSKYVSGLGYYEASLIKSTETLRIDIDDDTNYAYVSCSTSYLDDLKWGSLIFVVDRSSTTGLKLFIAGNEPTYAVQQDPTSVGDLDNTAEFAIGCEATDRTYKLNGSIDEFRVWNFGVDGLPTDYADYISWRHNNPLAPTSHYNGGSWNTYITNNLSVYYKFNGDYTDETSNSNDLTAGGSGNTFPSYSPERIKPTDTSTERVKPTDTATERVQPSDTPTERTKPT